MYSFVTLVNSISEQFNKVNTLPYSNPCRLKKTIVRIIVSELILPAKMFVFIELDNSDVSVFTQHLFYVQRFCDFEASVFRLRVVSYRENIHVSLQTRQEL